MTTTMTTATIATNATRSSTTNAEELAYMAENLRADRVSQGLCPSCGTRLFERKKKRGTFSSVVGLRKTSNASEFKPLTIAGQVARGQCLKCTAGKSGGDSGCGGASHINNTDNSTAIALAAMMATSDEQHNQATATGFSNKSGVNGATATTVTTTTTTSQEDDDATLAAIIAATEITPISTTMESSFRSEFYQGSSFATMDSTTTAGSTSMYGGATVVALPELSATAATEVGVEAIYKGNYNVYGERHGQGELSWCNGDRYVGSFLNGVREGEGTLFFADGSEYVGEWENNKMHGMGTRRFPQGNVYTGNYWNGKRQGEGRCYFANGDMYVGEWFDDNIHGMGRYYYSNGQSYEGRFVEGKRHGRGKYQLTDGRMDIYRYENDVRVGPGVRWNANRTKAWRLLNGKVKGKISLNEAMELAKQCGEDPNVRALIN